MLNVLHPWHGATYGEKAPATVNALIEIPQGSRSKYEVDKATGLLKLDRHSAAATGRERERTAAEDER